MHDEQDFLAAHGCTTNEEYDRKRFYEWVDAMEDHFIAKERVVVPRQRRQGIIIQPLESIVRLKPKMSQVALKTA